MAYIVIKESEFTKKLTIGIVIGLMLGISTNAFAAIGDTVSAVFAQFEYVVNGEVKTLDEPVLVHEGNSYLRTTQVANMLGYDVTYKADTRTIEFDKPEEVTEPTTEPTPIEPVPTEPTDTTETTTTTPTGSTDTTEPVVTEPTTTEPVTDPVTEPTTTTEPTGTTTDPDTTTDPTTTEPTATEPTTEPVVEPTNTAQCQAIRDDYAIRIFNTETVGDNPKLVEYNKNLLRNQRDAELAAAGC